MRDLFRSIWHSVWHEPRPPNAPPVRWRDWVLVAAVVTTAVLELLLRTDIQGRVAGGALVIAVAPALLWRRRRPLLMLVVAFAAGAFAPLLNDGQPPNLYAVAAMVLLPYALFRWGSGREAVIGSAVILGQLGFSLLLGHESLTDILGGIAVLSAFAALALAWRFRARARARELSQAKLVERERLARDLHDTVAHHVSAMAIRAQAGLATAATHPDAAADALRVIEAEASKALAEMRTIVRALRRDEPAERDPIAHIADVEKLVALSSANPAVNVEISGDVAGVQSAVAAAVFRLAQESVTNALRHARHATRVDVRVVADETSVRLRVSDDGDGGPPAAPGFGIIGMRERADLLGGTCQAGPDPHRGWTVTAVLPRNGVAA